MTLMSHPNIVSVFGVVRDPPSSTYGIIMELVERGFLCSLMKKLPQILWPVKVSFKHKQIWFSLIFYFFEPHIEFSFLCTKLT